MNSFEQCIELSAVEYQSLFGILLRIHEDNIKDAVICTAHDVASYLLNGQHRKDIYSIDPSYLSDLKRCNTNSVVTQ